jgi:hypothetical protein
VRVTEAYVTLIPLTLPLSREGRGKRIIVKGINAFVLAGQFYLILRAPLPESLFLSLILEVVPDLQ